MKQLRPGLFMLALASACLDPPLESVATSDLDTTNPGYRFGSPFSGPAMAWHWTDTGSDGDPTRCHDCSTTPSTDPATEVATSPTTLVAYAAGLGGWTSAVQDTFAAAAADGDAVLATTSNDNVSSTLADVKSDFDRIINALGGTGHADLGIPHTTPWVVGFPRVQARQLELEYIKDDGRFDAIHTYDPATPTLSELRMRGAKSFCAARSAAFEMDAHKTDVGYALYDHHKSDFLWWQTGVTGASLRLLPSTKHIDRQSEAFAIPFQLSSRLAPLAGPVMPSFGELVHPLVWLTADREIRSFEDWGSIHVGTCRNGPFGRPLCIEGNVPTYRHIARDLEHDDAMAGRAFDQTLTISDIQVVNWGWFSLKAGGSIAVETGKLDDPAALLPASGRVEVFGPFASLVPRLPILDDLLAPPSVAADAPLALNGTFFAFGGSSSVHDSPTSPATITRWRNDDDRAVTITDRIVETINLLASAGVDFGPLHIDVNGVSSINVMSQQDIALREQLSLVAKTAVSPPLLETTGNLAQTNLVAVPHSTSTFELHPLTVSLEFKVHIDTGFFSIDLDWHQPFFSLPTVPLADPDPFGGDEQQRMRIGEYSDAIGLGGFDGSSQQPKTVSYLVGKRLFQAFPTNVAACLADSRPLPLPDGPPTRTPTPGPVVGHTCAVGPGDYDLNVGAPSLPAGVCDPVDHSVRDEFARQASVTWSSNSTRADILAIQLPLERTCMTRVLDFVCRTTSLAVSPSSRSHVLLPSESGEYGEIVKACTTAFAYGVEDHDAAKAVGELVGSRLLPIRSCSADGTPDPM